MQLTSHVMFRPFVIWDGERAIDLLVGKWKRGSLRLSMQKRARSKEWKRVKKAYVSYAILSEETDKVIGIPEEGGGREQKLI